MFNIKTNKFIKVVIENNIINMNKITYRLSMRNITTVGIVVLCTTN